MKDLLSSLPGVRTILHVCVSLDSLRTSVVSSFDLGTTQSLRPKPNFSLQLDKFFDQHNPHDILNKLISLFRVATELRTLSVRPGEMTAVELSWLDILTHHPRLKSIRVDDETDFDHLFEALYFVQEPLPVRELRTVSLPRYKFWMDIWDEQVHWANPATTNEAVVGERGALLASVLLRRAAAGAPFTSMYLDQSPSQAHKLQLALARGGERHPGFLRMTQKIFKTVNVWKWEDWGRGL